jgi:hypothetical protein
LASPFTKRAGLLEKFIVSDNQKGGHRDDGASYLQLPGVERDTVGCRHCKRKLFWDKKPAFWQRKAFSGFDSTSGNTFNVGIGTTSPNSKFHDAGSFAVAFVAKTVSYTVTANDCILTSDATALAVTFTLPTAVGIVGRKYTFKRIDVSVNATVIDGGGKGGTSKFVLIICEKYCIF